MLLQENVSACLQKQNYKTTISCRNHQIVADEPEDLGGSDKGMAPYELLLASLGSCIAITLSMYAQRKEWKMEEIKVHLNLERSEEDGDTVTIHRELEITGDLGEKERQRMLKIADLCPVSKLLKGTVIMKSRLV